MPFLKYSNFMHCDKIELMEKEKSEKAWIVSVDMGYGHQRAAMPLAFLSPTGKVISANDYEGMPESDKSVWEQAKAVYYFLSRIKNKGFFGRILFSLYDELQKIEEFYPLRKENKPTYPVKKIYKQIKEGWGHHLIETLAKNPLPLITPYFSIAFMAEHFHYPGDIYALVTDSDISRVWAPLEPEKTRIRYFAPTSRVVERLKKYGIPATNIIFTGFPLPQELIGENEKIVKHDLRTRLARLDTSGDYTKQFAPLIESYLAGELFDKPEPKPPSLGFVVGGAGAQVEIGITILRSIAPLIQKKKLKFYLIAGTSLEAKKQFDAIIKKLHLENLLENGLSILFRETKDEYFSAFNALLHDLDIVWTKPSELSFYGALGIPLIIAPPIGAQEIQNRKWLLFTGAGIDELSPLYTHEWLPDFIANGRLAEIAMQGFIKMEREGVNHILETIK